LVLKQDCVSWCWFDQPTVRGSQFAVASGDLCKVLRTTWEAGASIYTLIAAALWGHAEEVRCWVEGMLLMFLVSFWDEMLRKRRDEFRGLNYCSLTVRGSLLSFFFKGAVLCVLKTSVKPHTQRCCCSFLTTVIIRECWWVRGEAVL